MLDTRQYPRTRVFPRAWSLGIPELTPLSPSEEHLPMAVQAGATGPQIGEALHLLPRHVFPTVNNFDCALLVQDGAIKTGEKNSAPGRAGRILHPPDQP